MSPELYERKVLSLKEYRIKGRYTRAKIVSFRSRVQRELAKNIMEKKIFVLYMIVRSLLAEETQRDFSFDRQKKDLGKINNINDYNDFSENWNSLYPINQDFLSDKLSEVKRRNMLYVQSFCPCESLYEIRDLGEGHYPRYLTISRCKPKACHDKFNACRLLQYKVHILSQRDTNTLMEDESYTEENARLPETLRYKWQLKPMYVSIVCVPDTDGRRN